MARRARLRADRPAARGKADRWRPLLPSSDDAGTESKRGKARPRRPLKKKGTLVARRRQLCVAEPVGTCQFAADAVPGRSPRPDSALSLDVRVEHEFVRSLSR